MAELVADAVWSAEGATLLLDKPVGLTSFDVIYRLRRWCGVEKAGHAGTLDPNASGLLIICVGRQTKRLSQFSQLDKEYVGSFQLGVKTPSFDMETEVSERHDFSAVTDTLLRSVITGFIGPQLQLPPMYSAVKHHGRPLYKYARKGAVLERKPREIVISEFVVTSFAPPSVEFRVVCSKGTYIRALVDDAGNRLGCGAVLTSLRRTRIGNYRIDDAVTLEQVKEQWEVRGVNQNEEHGYRIPA